MKTDATAKTRSVLSKYGSPAIIAKLEAGTLLGLSKTIALEILTKRGVKDSSAREAVEKYSDAPIESKKVKRSVEEILKEDFIVDSESETPSKEETPRNTEKVKVEEVEAPKVEPKTEEKKSPKTPKKKGKESNASLIREFLKEKMTNSEIIVKLGVTQAYIDSVIAFDKKKAVK